MPNNIIYFIYKYNNNKCLLIITNFYIFKKIIKDRKKRIIFRPIILYISF